MSKANASTPRASRLPSTSRPPCTCISIPIRARELRSVNLSSPIIAFMNSNSAGLRGQKASVRATFCSSLFLTVSIWPSWLVQNWSGLMIGTAEIGGCPAGTQAANAAKELQSARRAGMAPTLTA